MSKAAQGFSPEAYFSYVEGGNPRRTPLIGKIAIYGWKLRPPQTNSSTTVTQSGKDDNFCHLFCWSCHKISGLNDF
jgi:hypothetical protein